MYIDTEESVLFLTSSAAKRWFGDELSKIKRELRAEGVLQGEKGKSPKPSIKAPKCVPFDGRVYRFSI
ncbi:hypothetical protein OG2516_07148 [Oceanicola granulosus HTCC2516]|uniref:Uncharacterized protein n=2 Tax=Oceanicola granulosus TaxID=252302 RepID=Q2CCD0_OCEGH|nr:hypothetical protein OG2516_07148 [Oceanicola granulosus HTCC2516]